MRPFSLLPISPSRTDSFTCRTFELVVLQQPEIGAEAGLGKNTLGRVRPLSLSLCDCVHMLTPLLRTCSYLSSQHPSSRSSSTTRQASARASSSRSSLSGRNSASDSCHCSSSSALSVNSDVELPYLFCSCSLRQEDGVSPVEIAPPASAQASTDDGVAEEFSALIGQLVRTPRRVEDLEGAQKSVFVFEDVSVRTKGTYKLEFRLGEACVSLSPSRSLSSNAS